VGGACVCVNNVSTQAPPPKAFWGGACACHEHFGGGACVCHGHLGKELIHVAMRSLWLVSRKSPPDVYSIAVMKQSFMTHQPASPPDVYSIAVMTQFSSKVLVRFFTIKSITGRWLSYRKANRKRVQLYARPKFPGFDRGTGYSSFQLRQ
jgi:hypothetical protein